MSRPPAELEELLREHITFVRTSCHSFDSGFDGEAKRLAVSARVLLHDTPASKSLLGQMNLLAAPFYATAYGHEPRSLTPHHGLLQVAIGSGGASYHAPLDDRLPRLLRWTSFEEWWTEVVFDDRQGNSLTRKTLVLALANKDGGAHVDASLTPPYEALTKRNSLGWVVAKATGIQPLSGRVERLAMRQVAHEILRTLERMGHAA